MRGAAALCAHLNDAVVLAGSAEHRLSLDDVHTDGFLHVNIGAGFDCRDHRQGVPMVRRSDQNDVQIFFLEHLSVIGIDAGLFLGNLACCDHFRRFSQHPLIDITKRNDLDRSNLDQAE